MRAQIKLLERQNVPAGLVLFMLIFSIIMPASAEALQIPSHSELLEAAWVDEFNSSSLDPRWTWVNEDPTHWSLTESPGYLRIVTQQGSLFTSSYVNLLLTTPELKNYSISTKVIFAPLEAVHTASMVVYQDDQNYIQLSRRFGSDNEILFRVEVDDSILSSAKVPETATNVYLRITKISDFYIGAYSLDGLNWTNIGQYYVSFSDPQVGLQAGNGPSTTEINADFDYFRMDDLETVYVAGDGDCGSGSPCYSTLQAAVDASADSGVVKVAAGTYTDLNDRSRNDIQRTGTVTQVAYLDKNLNIVGGYDPSDWTKSDPQTNPTVLDPGSAGRAVYASGDIFALLDGFEIRDGNASGLGGFDNGGNEVVDAGGGIYVISATLEIQNSLLSGNQAELGGGAFFYAPGSGLIQDSSFEGNTADGGGGLSVRSGEIDLIDNLFKDNHAISGAGGAVEMFGSSSDFYGNLIIANSATNEGGGISVGMFDGVLEDNLILNNTAGSAGGIHVFGGNTWTNNVIVGNHAVGSAGAIDIQPVGPHLLHTTIAGNTSGDGTAITVRDGPFPLEGDIHILNSIISGQPTGVNIISGDQSLTIDHVLWHDVTTPVDDEAGSAVNRSNEMSGDPAFAGDGYHLTSGSAALDWGMDLGTTHDVDGEPRPNVIYDLGADEFWPYIYLPLIIN